jgi:hypothetical protein
MSMELTVAEKRELKRHELMIDAAVAVFAEEPQEVYLALLALARLELEETRERGGDVPEEGLELKALVEARALELHYELIERVGDTLEASAHMNVETIERFGLHRLLPEQYQDVQAMIYDRIGDRKSGSAYQMAWASRVLAPFAARTGAVPARKLDVEEMIKGGVYGKFQDALPAFRAVVEDEGLSEEEKAEKVREISAQVWNPNTTRADIRSMKRHVCSPFLVPTECRRNGVGRYWVTGSMTEQQEQVARRICAAVLDFSGVTIEGDKVSSGEAAVVVLDDSLQEAAWGPLL